MKRRGGPTSRFAYDPQILVQYLDAHADYLETGSPVRRKRVINRVPVEADTDARVIRRWRSGAIEGVTRKAADKLLTKFNLSTDGLEMWAYENAKAVVMWESQLRLPTSN